MMLLLVVLGECPSGHCVPWLLMALTVDGEHKVAAGADPVLKLH